MLKEKLELLVERLGDRDFAQRDNALKLLKNEISGATRSMTSVPKPLKFLSVHYKTIVKHLEDQTDETLKVSLDFINQIYRLDIQIWQVSSAWLHPKTKTLPTPSSIA